MSLDITENVETEKTIVFELNDSVMSTSLEKMKNNDFFRNLTCTIIEKDEELKIKVDLSLNDFFLIFSYISKGKNDYKGKIDNFNNFFNFCQYIGEIELPILISNNSELISKWYMSSDLLIESEKERMLLDIYKNYDKNNFDSYPTLLKEYKEDLVNNKLHEKTSGKLFKQLESIEMGSFIFPLDDDLDTDKRLNYPCKQNPYRQPNFKIKFKKIEEALIDINCVFLDFPWKRESGHFLLAGGSVLKQLILSADSDRGFFGKQYIGNDHDIFLITRSENEAAEMIHQVYNWIISISKSFFMFRTKNSVSFVSDKGLFQIILRLYHSKEQVLCGFDIDPCCVAFDGTSFLATKRGYNALKYKGFPVVGWRQSESFVYRCNKYFNRGFELYFPGVTDDEFKTANTKNVNRESSMLLKIINGITYDKTNDYDEMRIYHSKSVIFILRKISIMMDYTRNSFVDVVTKDINMIFDTELMQQTDTFSIKKKIRGVFQNTKISFIKEMCHGQISGSFKPTVEDWYKDVKW